MSSLDRIVAERRGQGRIEPAARKKAQWIGLVALALLAPTGIGCQSMQGELLSRRGRGSRELQTRQFVWGDVPAVPTREKAPPWTARLKNPLALPAKHEEPPNTEEAVVLQTSAELLPMGRSAVVDAGPPTISRGLRPTAGLTIRPADAARGPRTVNRFAKQEEGEAVLEAQPPLEGAPAAEAPAPLADAPELAAPIASGPVMIGPVETVTVASPARIVGAYGVSADEAGLLDNVSGRVGASFLRFEDDSTTGFVGILESSMQIHQWPVFVQGGIGAQTAANFTPLFGTVGASKLAEIQGDQVVKPLILSMAYDSYYDNGFLIRGRDTYLDQVRGLVGWAVRPWIDLGVWGAVAGQEKTQTFASPNGTTVIRTGFADRAAGYVGVDIPWINGFSITSVGWQEGTADYFVESDLWVPVHNWFNFWGGVGYSGNGNVDGAVGIEVIPSRWVKSHRAVAACDPCDPCCDPCAVACCDPCADVCAPRYRGGWANGVYRGALRTVTPARAVRWMDRDVEFIPPAPTPGPQTETPRNPPPPIDPPPPGEEPCEECCEPRIQGRPVRAGNLSRLLNRNGP